MAIPVVKRLINTQTHGGVTPLMKAAEIAHTPTVYFMMELGANPLLIDGRGRTAITYAKAFYPKHEIVQQLRRAMNKFTNTTPMMEVDEETKQNL